MSKLKVEVNADNVDGMASVSFDFSDQEDNEVASLSIDKDGTMFLIYSSECRHPEKYRTELQKFILGIYGPQIASKLIVHGMDFGNDKTRWVTAWNFIRKNEIAVKYPSDYEMDLEDERRAFKHR